MSIGADLLTQFKAALSTYGEALTVTRRSTTAPGATEAEQSVTFIIKPMTDMTAIIAMEGDVNAGTSDPHIFSCAGDTDIATTDRITWKGGTYRVALVQQFPVGGVVVDKKCHALRI
jgi:hypothetical protein